MIPFLAWGREETAEVLSNDSKPVSRCQTFRTRRVVFLSLNHLCHVYTLPCMSSLCYSMNRFRDVPCCFGSCELLQSFFRPNVFCYLCFDLFYHATLHKQVIVKGWQWMRHKLKCATQIDWPLGTLIGDPWSRFNKNIPFSTLSCGIQAKIIGEYVM